MAPENVNVLAPVDLLVTAPNVKPAELVVAVPELKPVKLVVLGAPNLKPAELVVAVPNVRPAELVCVDCPNWNRGGCVEDEVVAGLKEKPDEEVRGGAPKTRLGAGGRETIH